MAAAKGRNRSTEPEPTSGFPSTGRRHRIRDVDGVDALERELNEVEADGYWTDWMCIDDGDAYGRQPRFRLWGIAGDLEEVETEPE